MLTTLDKKDGVLPWFDADWYAFCQALYKGIVGEDWEDMYLSYREMSRAVGVKKPQEAQKAKALWKTKASKDAGEESYDTTREDNTKGRNETWLALWEEHLKDPVVALDKALKCVEVQYWGWTLARVFCWIEVAMTCGRVGSGLVPELWGNPLWEKVWPFLDAWDSVRLRTASTQWHIPGESGPRGEHFFSIQKKPVFVPDSEAFFHRGRLSSARVEVRKCGSEASDDSQADNVSNEALYVIGLHGSGDKISLCLQDLEMAKVALSCHMALDMLCQEMHELEKRRGWFGFWRSMSAERQAPCEPSRFVWDFRILLQLEHFVLGQDEGFPSFCCASLLLLKPEGRKVDLSSFWRVLSAWGVRWVFVSISARELRSDDQWEHPLLLWFISSHRRANTGLNHVFRVPNHIHNKALMSLQNAEGQGVPYISLKSRTRQDNTLDPELQKFLEWPSVHWAE